MTPKRLVKKEEVPHGELARGKKTPTSYWSSWYSISLWGDRYQLVLVSRVQRETTAEKTYSVLTLSKSRRPLPFSLLAEMGHCQPVPVLFSLFLPSRDDVRTVQAKKGRE